MFRLFYSYLKCFLAESLVINFRYFQTNLTEQKKISNILDLFRPKGPKLALLLAPRRHIKRLLTSMIRGSSEKSLPEKYFRLTILTSKFSPLLWLTIEFFPLYGWQLTEVKEYSRVSFCQQMMYPSIRNTRGFGEAIPTSIHSR